MDFCTIEMDGLIPKLGMWAMSSRLNRPGESAVMGGSVETNGVSVIMANLKFIGQLREGEYIHTGPGRPSVQTPSIFTSFSRFLWGDSRHETKRFLCQTIDAAFDIIALYRSTNQSGSAELCEQLARDLVMTRAGIENLKITYSRDRWFICELDVLNNAIARRLLASMPDLRAQLEAMPETDSETSTSSPPQGPISSPSTSPPIRVLTETS